MPIIIRAHGSGSSGGVNGVYVSGSGVPLASSPFKTLHFTGSVNVTNVGGVATIEVLSGSGGGGSTSGITQITGSLLASGSGIVGGKVIDIDGAFNAYSNNYASFIRCPTITFRGSDGGYGRLTVSPDRDAPLDHYTAIGYRIDGSNGIRDMWLGTDWEGRRAYQNFIDAQYGVEVAAVGRRAIRTGYGSSWTGGTGNTNLTMVQFAGGLQYAQQERVTGNSFQCDHSVANYLVELAVVSGGCTVSLPDLPYVREANAAPTVVGGRTLVFADVLGSLSVGNPLTLTDTTARTFNGAAGPFVVTDPYSVCTLTLDSTTNNWIVSVAVPTPSSGGGGGSTIYFESLVSGSIFTSGSTAFVGGLDEYGVITSPSDKGADVFFYVSGSAGSAGTSTPGVALFGGDVVASGSFKAPIADITSTLTVSGSMSVTGTLGMMGSIIPDQDTTYTLGAPNQRWGHVYTGDLHLRNDRGDWTIVEERDFLCVVNNITGKKYKMMLQPIDDESTNNI